MVPETCIGIFALPHNSCHHLYHLPHGRTTLERQRGLDLGDFLAVHRSGSWDYHECSHSISLAVCISSNREVSWINLVGRAAVQAEQGGHEAYVRASHLAIKTHQGK